LKLKNLIKKLNAKNDVLEEDLKLTKVDAEKCKGFTLHFIQKMQQALEDFAGKEKEWKIDKKELKQDLKFAQKALDPYINAVSNSSIEIMHLKEQKKNLLFTLNYLRDKEVTSDVKLNLVISENEELERKLEWQKYLTEFKVGTIAENAKNLVSILPIRSCIRYPIIRELTKGLQIGESSDFFSISRSTISRAKNNADPTILDWFFCIERDHVVYRINV